MELINLTQRIMQIARTIQSDIEQLEKLAEEKAKTERLYRISLAQEIFKLKQTGMQVTLIGDLARGAAAEPKFARDMADAMYTAKREALGANQAILTSLQSILKIQREIGE